MLRSVEPEWLDTLEASDPRARRSRRDLRLINFIMGNAGSVALALGNVLANGARIADLGAGDGTVMLRVARRIRPRPIRVELMLVDRAGAISAETIARFRELRWNATPLAADAIEWLQQAPAGFDVITANLFLHHFEPRALLQLLLLVSARTRVFVACEPRRSRFALAASRVLGLAGCGPETRHDAAVSVRAGFRGRELSQAWPAMQDWELREGPAGLFNHLFIAWQRETV
jgi:hypothetical protein